MDIKRTNRNLNLRTNAVASFLWFAVRIIITFFMTPLLIQSLGDRRYGVWSLVESVLAYLTLLDLGIAPSLVRFAAKFEAQRDWKDLNRTFNTCFALYLGLGTIAMVVTFVLALGWSRPLGAPADLAYEIRILLLLLGANVALRLPLGAFVALLDSLGVYPAKVAIRIFWSLLSALALVLVVKAGYGLVGVGMIVTFSGLGESLSLVVAAYWYLPQLRLSWRYVDLPTFRLIRGFSIYSFVAMIASRITFQTDALVIGAFLAPQHITFFMLGARLVETAKEIFRVISGPFLPAISSLEATNNRQAIDRLFLTGTRSLVWLAVPFQVGFLVLGRDFLNLWMGSDYVGPSFPVLVALSATIAFGVGQLVAAKVIYGMGNLRFFSVVVVTEAVANLVLSILLVKRFGILGVALGTVLPNIISSVIVCLSVCRMLEIRLRVYFTAVWFKPVLLGCLLGLLWQGMVWIIPITTWPRFVLVGSLGTLFYIVSALWTEFGLRGMGDRIRHARLRSA
jgi:O-antigen/teichoic acid export membrane protein